MRESHPPGYLRAREIRVLSPCPNKTGGKVWFRLNICMPTYTSRTCLTCQTTFQVLPRDLKKKFCSHTCSVISSRTLLRTINRSDNCTTCNISLRKGQYQFCSRSCAAKFNNKQRWEGHIPTKKKKSAKKISTQSVKTKRKKIVEYTRKCAVCSEQLLDNKKKYCVPCSPNISHYRTMCKFTFNVFDFPEEFDLSLIKTHGWFSPNGYGRKNLAVNLTGVSRDHLYTVADGFKNLVDPTLLAHPANCSILVHNGPNGNNSKKKSSITLDDLKDRIIKWNKRYGLLS